MLCSLQGRAADEKPVIFRGGLLASIIPEMNITDARAAVKVWAETAAARRGIQAVAVTDVYENISSFRKALVDGGPDVIGLHMDDFLPL